MSSDHETAPGGRDLEGDNYGNEPDDLGDLPRNSQISAHKKKKHISFSDDSDRPESPPAPSRARKESISPVVSKSTTPEWYSDLDDGQVNMFKQVFEMLDTDGGGSIDAEELYNVMKDMEIDVSLEEIKITLADLDKDGNGEIDFDEFLYCMSALGAEEEEDELGNKHYNKRQTLFFTAITKFAIKNSIGEIERYYSNKMRQAPHVISCYTAGARLIGLNDRQLEQEIRRMQKAAKNSSSPYAKPLPFVTLKKKKKKRPPERQTTGRRVSQAPREHHKTPEKPDMPGSPLVASHPPAHSASSDDLLDEDFRPQRLRDRRQSAVMPNEEMLTILNDLAQKGNIIARIPDIHLVPGIRQKIGNAEPLCSSLRKRKKFQQEHNHKITDRKKLGRKKTKTPHGWEIPKIERRQMPLPVIGVPKNRNGKFTIEDVADIRQKVSRAANAYYTALKKAHVKTAFQQWEHLHPGLIRSETLANAFRKAYRAYSPHKEDEVLALCPWIPGPRYTAHQPRVVVLNGSPPPLPPRPRTCPYRSSTPTRSSQDSLVRCHSRGRR